MPKKRQTDLEDLLTSLNKSEKRYVRLYLDRKSEGRESLWWDYFNKLSQGQQSELETNNQAERKAQTQARNQLKEYLLDALREYYEPSIPEHKILRYIADIQVLIKKEQFDLASTLLQAAWQLSERLSWSWYWPKLAQLDLYLVRRSSRIERIDERVREVEEALPGKMEETQEAFRMNALATRIFAWIRRGSRYEVEHDAAELEKIASDPLLQKTPIPGRLEANMRYHELWGIIEFNRRNYPQSLHHRIQLVEIFSNDQRRIAEDPMRYIVMLNNLIVSAIRLDDYEVMSHWLSLLRDFPQRYKLRNKENIAANVFAKSYSIEIYYLLGRSQHELIQPIISEIESGLKRYGKRLNIAHHIDFAYLISRAHFEAGRLDDCLDSLYPVINHWKIEQRTDIQVLGRVLALITHYELGNYRLLEATILNFRRFAKQAKHRNRVSQKLLRLLGRINYENQKRNVRPQLELFRRELDEINLSAREKLFVKETGIQAWLELYLETKDQRRAS
jgi:hypothetical protein